MATAIKSLRIEPASGAHLAVDELPGTRPPLVFLHGMSSYRIGEKSTTLFDVAVRIGRAAYRFDFRGHGDSSGELATTTLTELCEDTLAILRHTGPAILVGSSLGGLVASWTAARHPELVVGLTALAPAFAFRPRIEACVGTDGWATVPRPGDDPVRLAPDVLEDLLRFDEATLPARLTMPVQIVHGALDDTVPAAASRRVFDAIPHDAKELWILPDGDHRLNEPIRRIYEAMLRFHGLHRIGDTA